MKNDLFSKTNYKKEWHCLNFLQFTLISLLIEGSCILSLLCIQTILVCDSGWSVWRKSGPTQISSEQRKEDLIISLRWFQVLPFAALLKLSK